VIGKEVESALQEAMEGTNVRVNEFTVAPQINLLVYLTTSGLLNLSKNQRTNLLCRSNRYAMRKQNIYYDDLIVGNILRKVVITAVQKWFSGLYEINR
jgi:hypothetical protein